MTKLGLVIGQQREKHPTPPLITTRVSQAETAAQPSGGRALWVVGLIGVGVGTGAAALFLNFGIWTGQVENIGQYAQDFLKSPGFGGLAALLAAVIAFQGIRGQVQTSRESLANQQTTGQANRWWATFQWTADRALPVGSEDVPLPKPVAIATLQELAVTATDDAQRIACRGLVDVLGEESSVEASTEETIPSSSGKSDLMAKTYLATAALLSNESLDAALRSYADATQGSKAESSIARRRTYESAVRKAVAEVAGQLGLDYESDALLGQFGNPDLEERYRADGVIQRPGGAPTLVEVVAFERAGSRIVQRLKQLADNDKYPVVFVAPVSLPPFMDGVLRSPNHWIQWNIGDDLATLREAVAQAL